MNAAEQATNLELASKIATLVNRFKQHFPDARADLKPWASDPHTRATVDPESIDIGFHLPGWSPRYQCRSMLVQIRFYGIEDNSTAIAQDSRTQDSRAPDSWALLGLDVVGFSYQGEQWRLSTVGNWDCVGDKQPVPEIAEAVKAFCRDVFALFR